jgi:hypothetical protein
MITGLLGVVMLTAALLPGTAGADEDGWLPERLEGRLEAMAAIDVDPWELELEEIPGRRVPVAAYENLVTEIAADTAAARATVEEELAAAELVLDAARAHRSDMEAEVEGYSISMWVLGDLGLQDRYGSEAERARHGRPVIAVTEALIDRVEAADSAIVDAQAEVDAVSLVLAARVAADEDAQRELRQAEQIRERLDALVAVRDLAIDRLTHELLTEERPDVPLVTITSVTVQVPIEVPGDPAAAALGELAAGPEAEESTVASEAVPQAPPQTRAITVAIPPIVVNAVIADQVRALLGAARSDGIDLHGAGYRPREDQITLRLAHCGSSGYDIFDRPAGECDPPTAQPGASEHELGLAVDFTENGGILMLGSPGFQWMVAHADEYGLLNLPSEAWHWSTTGS